MASGNGRSSHPGSFNSVTARAAAARSHAARRRRQADELLRQQQQREAIERAAQNPQPAEQYIAERLARVRAQIECIDEMLMTEIDPQRLSWLANCSAKLAEQERILAGRPAPGAYRPSAPRRRSVGLPVLIPE